MKNNSIFFRLIEQNEYFCDKQIKGPYLFWEHYHLFSRRNKQTLMKDIVNYKVLFGSLTNNLLVKRDLQKIFEFRRKKIEEIFKKQSQYNSTCFIIEVELFIPEQLSGRAADC